MSFTTERRPRPSALILLLLLSTALPHGCSVDREPTFGPPPQEKVLLIAVDGLTWDLVDPFIERGRMPNFRRLIASGSRGRLESIMPITSPIIFTTISTGKTPDEHGILGFVKDDDTGAQTHYTNSDRRSRAFWNILSEHGRRVTIVGWFTSWPADVVNGDFISDRSETALEGGCYPPEIEETIRRIADDLTAEEVQRGLSRLFGPRIDRNRLSTEERRIHERIESSLEHYYRVDRLRLSWALELIRREQSDMTAVFFKGTDPAAHLTWAYMDPEPFRRAFLVPKSGRKRFGGVIPAYHEFIDEAVGRLVDAVSAETDIIIISDHGLGPATAIFAYHVNPVLSRLGLLESTPGGRPDVDRSLLIDPTPQGRMGQRDRRLVFNRHVLSETAGDPDARGRRVEAVAGTLRDLRTDNGEPLFFDVRATGGETAEGPRYAIDIRIPRDFQGIEQSDRGTRITGRYRIGGAAYPLEDLVTVRRERTGGHRIDGLIVMSGPRIKSGVTIEGASVYDIAPTLLRLAGLPAARDMSGRVLEEALDPARLPPSSPPVRTYEKPEPIRQVASPDLPEVEDELRERLRTLGYIQ